MEKQVLPAQEYYSPDYYQSRVTTIDPYLEYILTEKLVFGSRSRILDVGCGAGTYVNFFRGRNFSAWGIDFSEAAAKLSGQTRASALKLPFKDNVFDLVLSVHMIEHLNFKEAKEFLSGAMRVLKPGGRILLMTPNAFSPGRLFLGDKWFPDPSHINLYTPFRLKKELKEAGFSDLCLSYFIPLRKLSKGKGFIVKYYGLDKIFRIFPLLQDLLFFFMFLSPFSYLRDVIYLSARAKKE